MHAYIATESWRIARIDGNANREVCVAVANLLIDMHDANFSIIHAFQQKRILGKLKGQLSIL